MADTEYLSTRQPLSAWAFPLAPFRTWWKAGRSRRGRLQVDIAAFPATSVDALLARRRNLTPSALESGGQLDILIAEDDSTLQMLYQMTIES